MTKIHITVILLFALFCQSCSGFLEDYSQDQAYVRSYTDLDELLIGDGYLKSDFSDLDFIGHCPYIHLMADETQENTDNTFYSPEFSSKRDRYFGYYTWQKRVDLGYDKSVQGNENNDWKLIYEHINVTNMVIDEIDKWTGKTETETLEIGRVRGEAYFLRAMYYFWLVNLYGKPYLPATASTDLGVPLKTSPYIEDKEYTRNTVQEVYDLILSDLAKAEAGLINAPVKSVFRTNITATYLLLSRVHLYMRNWNEARNYAKKALEKNNQLIDLNTYEGSSFLNSGSVETIFSTGNNWVYMNAVSIKIKGMGTSQELLKQFKKGDLRGSVFFNNEHVDISSYRPCKKYGDHGSVSVSDSHLFRTAEAYLNMAEACAYLGDETSACNALNTLRQHRWSLTDYVPVSLTGKELIEEIRNERYRELCFEGHRWYDLRRYSVCDRYPLEKTLRNTYSLYELNELGDMVLQQTLVYELAPGDDAYTLPIPKEVLQFDSQILNNERPERGVSETINYN